MDEQERIHDADRVGAACDGSHLGVHVLIIPVDFRLSAETVVRELLEAHKERELLRSWLAAKLETLPRRFER